MAAPFWAERPEARLAGLRALLTALGCEQDDRHDMREQLVCMLERMTVLAR